MDDVDKKIVIALLLVFSGLGWMFLFLENGERNRLSGYVQSLQKQGIIKGEFE